MFRIYTLQQKEGRPSAPPCRPHPQKGFSLIEVMVVVVIMGIVAARQDIAALTQALKLYRLDNGRYPSTAQGLAALHERPAQPPEPRNWRPYMDRLPQDPWGNPYQYLQPGVRGEIDVFSLGADGRPGGEGTDADIGNWD